MGDYRLRSERKLAYLCECGAGLCDERVRLTRREYNDLADIRPALADGHGPGSGSELGKCPVCGGRHRGDTRKRR